MQCGQDVPVAEEQGADGLHQVNALHAVCVEQTCKVGNVAVVEEQGADGLQQVNALQVMLPTHKTSLV